MIGWSSSGTSITSQQRRCDVVVCVFVTVESQSRRAGLLSTLQWETEGFGELVVVRDKIELGIQLKLTLRPLTEIIYLGSDDEKEVLATGYSSFSWTKPLTGPTYLKRVGAVSADNLLVRMVHVLPLLDF
jgi:hypothetical protein